MRQRFADPRLAALVTVAAAWPLAGALAAGAEPGRNVEAGVMRTIDGGKHALVARDALANVFVFFRPGQEHSVETLRAMAGCEREFASKRVHWVAVVSDSAPRDAVLATVREAGIRMPVLVDEGDRLYGSLEVRLHPTIGVADRDAKLLAFEPFRKIHYCDVVRARIRLALGEIDAAEVERVVSPERAPMPGEIAGASERRNVRMGQLLLKAKRFDQAAETARSVIARDPSSAAAHVLLGDALAGRGDCGAAAKAYDEALRLEPGNAAASDGKRSCAGR
jgi:hypothetical protein